MKRISVVFVGLLFGLLSTTVSAANSKIGIVDLQKIMQTAPQMKEIQQKLEKQFKPRRDTLISMEDSIKKDMEKFKRDSAVMSAAQKKELQKKIIEAQQSFDKEGKQYQQELSAAHNQEMQGLYTKVRDAISQVAKNDKYDLILQKDAAPYSSSNMDVTDQVQKAIK